MTRWTADDIPPSPDAAPSSPAPLRPRLRDRPRARPPRRPRHPRRPRPRRAARPPGRHWRPSWPAYRTAATVEVGDLDLAEPGVGPRVRRRRGRPPARPAPARQQRRGHGHPAARDRRRLRDAARHEPPRAHGAHAAACCPLLARTGVGGAAPRAWSPCRATPTRRAGSTSTTSWASSRYKPWGAYAQSKLANLLFTFELQRRLDAAGLPVGAYAAHPGYSATNLLVGRPGHDAAARSAQWASELARPRPRPVGRDGRAAHALRRHRARPAPASYVGPRASTSGAATPGSSPRGDTARDESVAAALWDAQRGAHRAALRRRRLAADRPEAPRTTKGATGEVAPFRAWRVQDSNQGRRKPTDLQSAPIGRSGNPPSRPRTAPEGYIARRRG